MKYNPEQVPTEVELTPIERNIRNIWLVGTNRNWIEVIGPQHFPALDKSFFAIKQCENIYSFQKKPIFIRLFLLIKQNGDSYIYRRQAITLKSLVPVTQKDREDRIITGLTAEADQNWISQESIVKIMFPDATPREQHILY